VVTALRPNPWSGYGELSWSCLGAGLEMVVACVESDLDPWALDPILHKVSILGRSFDCLEVRLRESGRIQAKFPLVKR